MPVGKPGKVPATCHPDRDHWSRGMCASCYQTWWRKENPERYAARPKKPAKCHPTKPVPAQGLCQTCYRRKWRAENDRAPERARGRDAYARNAVTPAFRKMNALRARAARYGLTVDEMAELLDGKVCAVCSSKKNLHVDHCHDTGEIRGILCGGCNSSAGHAGDDPARLRAIAGYLESSVVAASSAASTASSSPGASEAVAAEAS